jgi:hypothetical protein
MVETGKGAQRVAVCFAAKQTLIYPSSREEADELRQLASRLARLAPSHRDPAAYFETKSDLVDALRQIAARR